jgi:aminocarboxymuconate-semialdehyde decarboxylase
LPEEYFARREQIIPGAGVPSAKAIPCLFDLDIRFRIMDQFDGYQQILSLASPPLDGLGPVNVTENLTRLGNDGLAGLVRAHPDRFVGALGNLPLNAPEASLRELQRLQESPEFVGIQIYSNVCGRPLDTPETLDVIEEALRFRMPIYIHPWRTANGADYVGETSSAHYLWQVFGWPYETTIAMARLVFAGLFDRHPEATIITHHTGAMVPYFGDRIKAMYDLFNAHGADRVTGRLAHPPHWYFTRFYADTALNGGVHALRCALEYFSPERVLFDTDTPFDAEGGSRNIRETIAALDASGLSTVRRQMVDEGNLRRLLTHRSLETRSDRD